MKTGRSSPTVLILLLALVAMLSGCAQSGSGMLARRPMFGTLKESLSRLEYQKDALDRKLVDAQEENRKLAKEIEFLEVKNGDMATQLDYYRNLARSQGGGPNGNELARPSAPDGPNPRSTMPARSRNLPPWTQIPYHIEPIAPPNEDLNPPSSNTSSSVSPRSGSGSGAGSPSVEYFEVPPYRNRSTWDSQSRRDASTTPWLPIAREHNAGTRGWR